MTHRISSLLLLPVLVCAAAVPDRVTRPVDSSRLHTLAGIRHPQAQAQFDAGPVDPSRHVDYVLLMFKRSDAQQSELDSLLADQQNPGSPHFRQWLSPEEFGVRFGLSVSDHSKVIAWLTSQGLTIRESGRARSFVAFSGTAEQISKALHTPIHRFRVNGEDHFANTVAPSVPEAFADISGGIVGLDDFPWRSPAVPGPASNSGSSHFLAPEDFATIYNVTPLYQAGFDGTGQSIAVVGQSNLLLTDIQAFRKRYNLPANDPKFIPYNTTDPGINGFQSEGNLDVEWAGAIAPNAKISYVYGTSAFSAMIYAINANLAPVISVSYLLCEVNNPIPFYRSITQQANAQGITILAASGDAGPAGCDVQGSEPLATRGRFVVVPAVLPEVTAVGGTQFLDGGGAYWATTNSANFGSALSYIPEAAWNESGTGGLLASGGGVSNSIPKPAWQNGPGVPNDGMRDVPDISLTAAVHDSYLIYLQGVNTSIAGTSAGTPSMAGVLALLNQYQVAKGFQKQPGLGNINPQLYRLAQSVPSVFHDVTNGDTVVQCSQGSPDCLTGTIGYPTGAGYDMATGLGSIDAASLFAQWNSVSSGTTVNVIVGAARVTVDDTLAITAEVLPVAGKGTPTGTVSFAFGTTPLGTASLVTRNGQQFADIFVPVYLFEAFGSGIPITAQYSGDAAFSGSGGSRTISIVSVPGTAAVIPTYSNTIFPSPPDGQGPAWSTTIGVFELAGVPAMITGITLDGAPQKISDYTQSPNIPAGGSVTLKIVFRNLAAPVARTFTITGTDVNGNRWSRTFSINYNPPLSSGYFVMNATPLTVTQNTSADPSCQWAVQLNVDDFGGFLNVMGRMDVGNVAMNASQLAGLFGTDRMDAYGSLTGTVCYGSNVKPPTTDTIDLTLGGLFQQVSVSLLPPPANPGKLTIAPAAVSLGKSTTSTVTVNLSDKTQPWTAAIYPANRTTSWLTASQYSGTGSGQIVLTANPTGFEPGVYRATVVIQSPNTMPQYINVPVMFVLGGSIRGTAITAVASPADGGTTGAPGMSLTIYGTNLANTTAAAMGSPLAYSLGGVTATVNGLSAPLLFVSPTQVNIQIPYACGAGPAVVGINNNGEIAGISLVVAPSAPSIFADGNGFATGVSTVKAGAVATVYFTGAGEISPTLKTAYAPTSVASSLAYLPVQGVQVTVGGVPAFVLSTHLAVNEFGTMQVSFVVPDSLASGAQPVVVTVGKSASKPTNITVQ